MTVALWMILHKTNPGMTQERASIGQYSLEGLCGTRVMSDMDVQTEDLNTRTRTNTA